MSSISLLRSRTAAAHEAVDAAFGGFDLLDREAYTRFLAAHAKALPIAEARAAAVWPDLRPRLPLLAEDLVQLGHEGPVVATPRAANDDPRAWGALYVVEGSRLGGGMLARQVGGGLPTAYLAATHAPGEWRDIRSAIDAAGEGKDEHWAEELVAGALETFDLYAAAARAA